MASKTGNSKEVKSLVYHVAPNKKLRRWAVIREGEKEPEAKGLSKSKAIKAALRAIGKKALPAMLLIYKTRYIIERQMRVSG